MFSNALRLRFRLVRQQSSSRSNSRRIRALPGCGQRAVTLRSGHDRGERLEQGRRLILDIGLDGQRGVMGTGLLRRLKSQLQLVGGSRSFLAFVGLKIFLAGRKFGDRERSASELTKTILDTD